MVTSPPEARKINPLGEDNRRGREERGKNNIPHAWRPLKGSADFLCVV